MGELIMEKGLQNLSAPVITVNTEDVYHKLVERGISEEKAREVANSLTENRLQALAWSMFDAIYSHDAYQEALAAAIDEWPQLLEQASKEVV